MDDKHRFQNASDSRGRPIRGLWVRNKDRYYVQLRVPGTDGFSKPRRVPLKARTLSAAVAEAEDVRSQIRSGGQLPPTGKQPTLAELISRYLEFHSSGSKRESTMRGERYGLGMWSRELGGVKIGRLNRAMLLGVVEKRAKEGSSNRTINHSLTMLRNALRYGQQLGFVQKLPTEGIEQRRVLTPKKTAPRPEDLDRLCTAAVEACPRTGDLLADFVRFLAYSGAREQEALRVRWHDVNFEKRQVTIGADGHSKNGHWRIVDMNRDLERHLREMTQRRSPNGVYLFPSPRTKPDAPERCAKRLRSALETARVAANLPNIAFHDMRRYFASYCAMSGVNLITVAKWLGHDSGTMLLEKRYAHLMPEHMAAEASKVTFTLTPKYPDR